MIEIYSVTWTGFYRHQVNEIGSFSTLEKAKAAVMEFRGSSRSGRTRTEKWFWKDSSWKLIPQNQGMWSDIVYRIVKHNVR